MAKEVKPNSRLLVFGGADTDRSWGSQNVGWFVYIIYFQGQLHSSQNQTPKTFTYLTQYTIVYCFTVANNSAPGICST